MSHDSTTTPVRAHHVTAMADRFEQAVANRMLVLGDAGARSAAYHTATRTVNRRRKALARLARALDHQLAEASLRERQLRHRGGDHTACLPAQCLMARYAGERRRLRGEGADR